MERKKIYYLPFAQQFHDSSKVPLIRFDIIHHLSYLQDVDVYN